MVNKNTGRGNENFPVQIQHFCFSDRCFAESSRIKIFFGYYEAPVEFVETVIIRWFDEGEYSIAERDFAKGVTELTITIEQDGPNEEEVEPFQRFNLYFRHFVFLRFSKSNFKKTPPTGGAANRRDLYTIYFSFF
jgi:hypothetical protein